MKVLLLTLVLSLVCADLSTTDLSQFPGEWKTLYLASNNLAKISESSPFRSFVQKINFDTSNTNISFDILFRNGECVARSLTGTRMEGNVFNFKFEGSSIFQLTYASGTSLLGYTINVDENNEVSTITVMLGKSNHVNELDFAKFKELTQEKKIPEANIVDFTNSGNETTFFPEYLI